MTYTYEFIIYWGAEDQAFITEVPELPGCVAHGSTPAEALSQSGEAITLWIETARELDDPVPESKGRRLMYA